MNNKMIAGTDLASNSSSVSSLPCLGMARPGLASTADSLIAPDQVMKHFNHVISKDHIR